MANILDPEASCQVPDCFYVCHNMYCVLCFLKLKETEHNIFCLWFSFFTNPPHLGPGLGGYYRFKFKGTVRRKLMWVKSGIY
jgi:hypothetical protein